jgi:hypothetical protein
MPKFVEFKYELVLKYQKSKPMHWPNFEINGNKECIDSEKLL